MKGDVESVITDWLMTYSTEARVGNTSTDAGNDDATVSGSAVGHYRAECAEFDCLWETGRSSQNPERMQQLLLLIEQFEGAFD